MSFLTKKGLRYFWAHIAQRLEQKVTVEQGKGLSTNDYTDEEKLRLATIAADHLTSVDKAELNGAIAEAVKQAAQADWNVNDVDDPAYIKNRTHGIIPLQTQVMFAFVDPSDMTVRAVENKFIELVSGDRYLLHFIDYLGKEETLDIIADNGFIRFPFRNEICEIRHDAENKKYDVASVYIREVMGPEGPMVEEEYRQLDLQYEETFILYKIEEGIKQLDEKFIPSTIARVENIPVQEQGDWAENNINSVSYIKNRTHYETTEVVTVLDETIDLIADQIVKVPAIPGNFIIDYNQSGIEAYFDEEPCIILDNGDSWELYDSNNVVVLTIWSSEGGSNCLVTPYAGSGQHTLRFTVEQAKVIKLDDKFIPDSIPRNLDIPFLAAPDWAADDGESGFIKNRTHYEQRGENYLEETSVTVDSNLYAELPVPKVDIVPGETYEVILNGEKFVCVAWKAPDQEDTVFLGNGESAGYPEQGEDVSFYFDYYASDSSFYLNAAEGDYTVCINAPRILVKLDEKYIPETIARASDIPEVPIPNWNSEYNEKGYIIGRTHYEGLIPTKTCTTISEEALGSYRVERIFENRRLYDGDIVRVTFNGEIYYCKYNNDIASFGNLNILDPLNEDTGEPFVVTKYNSFLERGTMNTRELVPVNVLFELMEPGIKQLDEKFIPSTIARTSSVEEVATNLETLSNSLVSVATTGDYNDLINTPTDLATTSYVDTKVSELVDSSPETLNTLNELAKALGEDPNFATTVSTQIGEIRNDLNAHTNDVISIDEIDAICGGTIQSASEVMF